jgi:hypothetical protein
MESSSFSSSFIPENNSSFRLSSDSQGKVEFSVDQTKVVLTGHNQLRFLFKILNFISKFVLNHYQWAAINIDDQQNLYVRVNDLAKKLNLNQSEKQEMDQLIGGSKTVESFVAQKLISQEEQKKEEHLIQSQLEELETINKQLGSLNIELEAAYKQKIENNDDKSKSIYSEIFKNFKEIKEKKRIFEENHGTKTKLLIKKFSLQPQFIQSSKEVFSVFKKSGDPIQQIGNFIASFKEKLIKPFFDEDLDLDHILSLILKCLETIKKQDEGLLNSINNNLNKINPEQLEDLQPSDQTLVRQQYWENLQILSKEVLESEP